MDKIFVQIASYRDPELLPTIRNCIDKAKYPENLTFGIAWQHSSEDTWDTLDEFIDDTRFRILDINSETSLGVCWARSLTQMLYKNEKFSLQIDSHSRFVDEWDEKLVNIWTQLDDKMAILTGYPPNYSPNLPKEEWDNSPQICNVYGFSNGVQVAYPRAIVDFKNLNHPINAVHISAGFIFATGDINKKVLYDPDLYFMGEEANLSIRYYTHGYNMYHPHILILHHFYTRSENKKHWTDHKSWGKLANIANSRLNALVNKSNDIDLKIFGLGNVRTLEDYKCYAGIDYENYLIHDDTKNGIAPPCSNSMIGWSNSVELFDKIIIWEHSSVPTCPDPRFWAIFVCDQHKTALHRIDVEYHKYPDIIAGETNQLKFEFSYKPKYQNPSYILIWPYSESNGWIENIYLPLRTL